MTLLYHAVITSPIGKLGLCIQDQKLCLVDFAAEKTSLLQPQNDLLKTVAKQINSYFTNPNTQFTIPFIAEGTPFQQSVWQAMQQIPVGSVLSYGQLAKQLKSSPRAIGNACRRNPLPIVIPCHRIVAANHIGGFSGAVQGHKIDMKTWLLRHEGVTI